MSLKAFHVFFVSLASLLCFGFGGWSIHHYRSVGGAGTLAMGIAALALGMGLIFYGRWFLRKITTQQEDERRRQKVIRKLPMVLVAVVLGHVVQSDLWACSSCYGEAAGPIIDGARMGVFVMFGFVLLMQFSFATFFICLWRRGRRSGEPETND